MKARRGDATCLGRLSTHVDVWLWKRQRFLLTLKKDFVVSDARWRDREPRGAVATVLDRRAQREDYLTATLSGRYMRATVLDRCAQREGYLTDAQSELARQAGPATLRYETHSGV